jgi:hypothetical protein
MVSPIENLTEIQGTLVLREPHPSLDGYELVTMRVSRTWDVPGRANLLHCEPGSTFSVTVRSELLGDAAPGDELRCRAKRVPDGAMCEPHPEAANFGVTRAVRPPTAEASAPSC